MILELELEREKEKENENEIPGLPRGMLWKRKSVFLVNVNVA